MATKKKMLQAAAGQAGGAGLDITDVFSTYLYEGNGSTQTITNGIDLAGEGGLVWIKSRSAASDHSLVDTARGVGARISTNSTSAQDTYSGYLSAFNSNGFDIGYTVGTNNNGDNYASWTFRKAPKFFTCLTYTGDGVAGRTISHDLGTTVGMLVVKRTDAAGADWIVYHRSEAGKWGKLNLTSAFDATYAPYYFGNNSIVIPPTSTEFTVGNAGGPINASGGTYVAYLFAHNDGDGGFGPNADQDIIKCGSYTGNGSTDGPEIDLGFEPQWLLIKNADYAGAGWSMWDNMRGVTTGGNDQRLYANESSAEATTGGDDVYFTATGFGIGVNYQYVNNSGDNIIYIAIRRGTKVPESGTEVFDVGLRSGSGSDANTSSNILTDASIIMRRDSSTEYNLAGTRLQGLNNLFPESTSAEGAGAIDGWDTMAGLIVNGANGAVNTGSLVDYSWKRAPGFFDVVAYSGNSTAGNTVSHNLTVPPEMIWVKKRNVDRAWKIYHSATGSGKAFEFDTATAASSVAFWNNTNPTESAFTLGSSETVNGTGDTYISYLFSTLAGVSKVGSYTGNGTSQTIDCGFTSGARFVLIKGTSSSGFNWNVYDTARGIVAGNDSRLSLDTTFAEVSVDEIDPHSSGFSVTSAADVNMSGQSYIFYAIA